MKFFRCASLLAGLVPGLIMGMQSQTSTASGGHAAVTTTVPVDPKKLPIIEDIFRLTKPDAMMQQMLTQYKGAFQQAASQGFNQEVRKFDDPAKYQADFKKLEDRVFVLLNGRLDWSKLKPQFVQLYSDSFTTDELSGMDAFYKSPAGHAALQKMPVVLDHSNRLVQQQMQSAGPELQKMMTDFMADIKKRSDASKAKAAPAAPPAK